MARNRSIDNDDDEDDDRPRKRAQRRDYDDDDEDDDSRPKRKRKKKQSTGNGLVWIIVGVGVLCLLGIGLVGFLMFRGDRKKPDADVADRQGLRVDSGLPVGSGGSNVSKQGFGIAPIPSITPSVLQVVFAGGVDGFAAVVSNTPMGPGYKIDVVKPITGKTVGEVLTESATDIGYAISPDGTSLAVLDSKPSDGNSVSLYSVAKGQLLKRFTPYSRGPSNITGPEAVWINFTSKDRLLTISSGGGFDLWSVPEMKRLTGIAPSLKAGNRIDADGFTHSPKNFSVSSDGKTLVMFNGSGFSFYDPETATESSRTEDLLKPGTLILCTAAAFSPDGKRFACYYQTFAGKNTTIFLNIWDTKTGKMLNGPGVLAANSKSPAGFAWWGSNHLLFWEGGISSARLFDLASGQLVGNVKTSIPGKFGTVPPNGQLWAVVGPHNYDPIKGAAFLVRADVPAAIAPGSALELSREGVNSN